MRELIVESGMITPPDEEAVRAQLDAILNSPQFKRSERHSRFLRFVCETTLKGEAFKLNEYLIAHAVFDRGEDYSSGEDSVVRRQAYSLRQKLQEYYANEGAKDPVRIELPVGRYVPTFSAVASVRPAPVPVPHSSSVERPPTSESPLAGESESLPVTVTPRIQKSTIRRVLWIGAAVVLAAGCFLAGRVTGPRPNRPTFDRALSEIWGSWLTDPQGAFICFSNPITTVVKPVDEPFPPDALPHPVKLSQEQADEFRNQLDLPRNGFIYLYPGIGHAKMGEALGSIAMTALLTRAGIPVRATQSRFLSWDDFRTKNLILLGHDEANRWLDPILSKLPLRLARGGVEKPRRVINTRPRDGELAEYWPDHAKTSKGRPEDYALVSMISGIDDRHRLLLINGVNTEGTQVAEEFLTDTVSMRRLLAMLQHNAPGHTGPWRFQMLLHAEVRDNVPTRVNIVIVRVL